MRLFALCRDGISEEANSASRMLPQGSFSVSCYSSVPLLNTEMPFSCLVIAWLRLICDRPFCSLVFRSVWMESGYAGVINTDKDDCVLDKSGHFLELNIAFDLKYSNLSTSR